MAEIHIIGQILGGSGFPSLDLFCKWSVVTGSNWQLLEGLVEGQTQVDNPLEGKMAVWSHPIDLHYTTRSISGWPKLKVQVWHQDRYGRNELYGYGFCNVPTSAGIFSVDCVTWRPKGSVMEEVSSFFLGGTTQLANDDLIISGADRYNQRFILFFFIFHFHVVHFLSTEENCFFSCL
eukprot:TRINITY_DN1530_c0_g1_i4.p1 TRINITY_DN1530_c0_g1~~TRINITY_DN1530_c0_g1_i4.p1  ORF type:complete len:178 (+),score=18.37 TRINITY_DN1530_c0_g1_i4:402-935(+)